MTAKIMMVCMLCKHEFECHDIAASKAVCRSCEEFYFKRLRNPAASPSQPARLAVASGPQGKALEPGLLGIL
jgi:hypothetical protein